MKLFVFENTECDELNLEVSEQKVEKLAGFVASTWFLVLRLEMIENYKNSLLKINSF